MKKRIFYRSFLLIMICFISSNVFAQKVDFSGNWKMNQEKSDLTNLGVPQGTEIEIKVSIIHNDPQLQVKQVVNNPMTGEEVSEMKYTTDGKECKNVNARGNEIVSKCKWENGTLIVESELEIQGNPASVKTNYSLSKDKKMITSNITYLVQGMELTGLIVYERVEK